MIQATFKQKNGKFYWYKVTGHAQYDILGHDIVCAGVSSLYVTITNELMSLGRTFQRDDGYFILDGSNYEDICLKLLYDGIKAIAEQYPDYCKVEVIA